MFQMLINYIGTNDEPWLMLQLHKYYINVIKYFAFMYIFLFSRKIKLKLSGCSKPVLFWRREGGSEETMSKG